MQQAVWRTPFLHMARRLMRPRRNLSSVAERIYRIAPAEHSLGAPAFFLEDHLDNVSAVHPETRRDIETARIRGFTRHHGPTMAYSFRNMTLIAGSFFGAGMRHMLAPFRPVDLLYKPQNVTCGAMVTSFMGHKYFGHWLRDDCATHLLAQGFGSPLMLAGENWPDRKPYMRLLQLDADHLRTARIERLFLFSDHSQNSHKARRYRRLRARVAASVKPENNGHKVYLRRTAGRDRRAVWREAELMDRLAGAGFTIVDPATLSLEKLLSKLLGARLIVTLEGSQQNHALMTLAPDGGLLNLQPPDRFNNVARDWTEALGLSYGFVVGTAGPKGATEFQPEDILRVADMMERPAR